MLTPLFSLYLNLPPGSPLANTIGNLEDLEPMFLNLWTRDPDGEK